MNRTAKQFEGLLARYFETLLQDNPTFSTICAGLRDGEGKLGRLTLDFQKKRERERQSALRALEGVSPRELSREQQLDRLALRSLLLKECEDYARARHALEPNAPDQLLNILLHELQRGDDEPRRAARNLRSLLRQAPDFLDEAAAVVRNPERVWLRVMEQTVTGGMALLEGVGKFLQTVAPQPGDAALIRAAGKAMQRYRERVKQRPLAPAGSFAIGAAALQRRVRDELGLDYTLGQVEALALGEVERVGKLLKAACARFGRNRSAEQIIAEARSQWRPAKPLLELYQRETQRIAAGFRQARAVSFPQGDVLQVKPVPEFLRAVIPTAAYQQPAAFAKAQRGVFWVNDLSVTKQHRGREARRAAAAFRPSAHLRPRGLPGPSPAIRDGQPSSAQVAAAVCPCGLLRRLDALVRADAGGPENRPLAVAAGAATARRAVALPSHPGGPPPANRPLQLRAGGPAFADGMSASPARGRRPT